ncbi:MAG TPA: AAA family ATPase [Vitreimonas sp.]|nr:AAA family ATPase [Vitreimonas sp.]
MKLLRFRVKNYKSIIDSGECNFEDGITIFAGKNEAGKTALLEALEDFNSDIPIREKAKSLFRKDRTPEVALTFSLQESDNDVIKKQLKIEPNSKGQGIEITINKRFPSEYFIDDKTYEQLFGVADSYTTIKEKAKDQLQKLINSFRDREELHHLVPDSIEDFTTYNTKISKLRDALSLSEEKKELLDIVQNVDLLANQLSLLNNIQVNFIPVIKTLLPNFILFRSFDETFPSTLALSDVQSHPLMKDLALITGLDLNVITSGEIHEKLQHKEQLNLQLKQEYKRFWSQDFSNIQIDWDSEQLMFQIREDESYYPPEIRSQGKRWHLAFYIRITARSKEEKDNILLIDEPGLFLHASAQRDILNKLEDTSKKKKIIFTTHSPYLIDTDKLHRIRLVQRAEIPKLIEAVQISEITDDLKKYYEEKKHKKDDRIYYQLKTKVDELTEDEQEKLRRILYTIGYNIGTHIESKIHKVADKETLTPLLTAIGLELTSGVVNLDKKSNIVCEGPSDVYYLNSFKLLTGKFILNFIFGGGSGNMPFVGTILNGWGCNVLYLYDNDKGKKDAEKHLRKDWLISKEEILSVLDSDNSTIEDIFAAEDFKKYVLEDESVSYTSKNSEYIKQHKKDKVLLSRNFLKLTEQSEVKLSSETIDRVIKLFEEAEKRFKIIF